MAPILGCARLFTDDQDLVGQKWRLDAGGASRVFDDVVSGRTQKRPGLAALLDHIRPGDTLAVVRLERLGRSLRDQEKLEPALLLAKGGRSPTEAAGQVGRGRSGSAEPLAWDPGAVGVEGGQPPSAAAVGVRGAGESPTVAAARGVLRLVLCGGRAVDASPPEPGPTRLRRAKPRSS